VTIGSVVQGSIGFGLGLIAAPVLALVNPVLVPGPLLCTALLLTILIAIRERAGIDLGGLRYAIVGRIPGTVAGAAVQALVSQTVIGVGFGIIVLAGVIMSAVGPRFEQSRPALLGAGFLSGLMGTSTSVGGPPMALLYQHAEAQRIRATLAGFFSVGVVMSLTGLGVVGRFGWIHVKLAMILVPGALLGFAVSKRVASVMDLRYARPTLLVFTGIAGVAVMIRSIL
jgi:uncharacterized protein